MMEEVRLIDANALIKDIESCRNIMYYSVMNREIHDSKIDFALDAVRYAPTIEAEPVRHGRWIHDINNLYGCSECLKRDTMSRKRLKPYCPHCGAKMDGGADNATNA